MVNKFSIHEVSLVPIPADKTLESVEIATFHILLEILNLKKEKK